MLPELLRLPWLNESLPTYGLLLIVAFVLGTLVSARLAEKDGLTKKPIYDLALYVLPCSVLGTKLLLIIVNRSSLGEWSRALSLYDSGALGAYWGGFLVCLGVGAVLVRLWQLPWSRIADVSAPGLALGNVIGRIGCFAGGCCWGKPTTSWIGVRFTERAHQLTGVPTDTALVPTQLIQAAINLIGFLFLLRLWRGRGFQGQVFLAYLILYSVERFIVDFWRNDPRGEMMGLSTSQFISAVILPIAVALMVWRSRAVSKKGYSHPSLVD